MTYFLLFSIMVLLVSYALLCKEGFRKKSTKVTHAFLIYDFFLCLLLTATILQQLTHNFIDPMIFQCLISTGFYMVPAVLLTLYIMFIKPDVSKKILIPIFTIPFIFIFLTFTNNMHGLLYKEFVFNYVDRVPGPLYIPSLVYVYGTIIFAFAVLVYGNFKQSNQLTSQLTKLFLTSFPLFIITLLYYCKIIVMVDYLPSTMLCLHGIFSYFIIIKYQYMNAVPIGIENAVNFLGTPLVVIDVHGEIVYRNSSFVSTIQNVLGIFLDVPNIFTFLSAFNKSFADELRATLKDLYKVKGSVIKNTVIYGLQDKLYMQIAIQEIKGTNYFLLVLRNVNQQKQEILDITTKQSIINVQSQLATVGELALGVAHDINTPITALTTAITLLEQTQLTEKEQEIIDSLKSSAKKISTITSSIKDQFKNADSTEKDVFSLSNFIAQTAYASKSKIDNANCKLILDLDEGVHINGNSSKLSQVILNILFNSIKAYETAGTHGEIKLSTYVENKNAIIEISDNAGGIPKDLRPFIFKNILTTKGTKGFGLGLYISNSIIQGEFNGKITFECPNNSTIVKVSIPDYIKN